MQLVGVYISTLRNHLGLTQIDVAQDADVSERTVRTIEKGAHKSSYDTVLHIVERLGGDTTDLTALRGRDAAHARAVADMRHETNVRLAEDRVRVLQQMSPQALEAILRAADARRRRR